MLPATKFSANTLLLISSDLVLKIFNFLFFVFLARNLKVEDFGFYNFLISFFFLFWVISDFGLQYLIGREVAENKFEVFRRSFATRFYLSFFVFLCYLALALTVPLFANIKLPVIIYGLSLIALSVTEGLYPIFRGMEKFKYERSVLVAKNTTFVLAGFLVAYYSKNILLVIIVYLLAEIVGAVLAVFLFNKDRLLITNERLFNIVLNFRNFSFALLKKSFPLFAGVALLIFYYKTGGLMIKFLKGDYELGIYSSAYRIFEALLFIPVAIHSTLLPRLMKTDKANYDSAINKVIKMALLMSSLLSIFIIYSSEIIPFFYGQADYRALSFPLRIISLATPIAFINYIFIAIAYVEKKELNMIVPLASALLFNLTANYLLIPKYSYIATSWLVIATEIFLFLMISFFASDRLFKKMSLVARSFAAFLVALVPFGVFNNHLSSLPLGLILFVIGLYILRVFNKEDVRIISTIIMEMFSFRQRSKELVKN